MPLYFWTLNKAVPQKGVSSREAEIRAMTLGPSPEGAIDSFTSKFTGGRGCRNIIHKEDHRRECSPLAQHCPGLLQGSWVDQ